MHYQVINSIAAKIDPELSAAEIHGIASGMVCVNNRTEFKSWMKEIAQDYAALDPNDKAALEELFIQTSAVLNNQEFDFDLLLPDDNCPLPERLEALRQWCRGYLFGIGTGAFNSVWPEDMREVIKDISELTKLDSDAEGEDAESDFMEIAEYVKTGVVFINAELNSLPSATLH